MSEMTWDAAIKLAEAVLFEQERRRTALAEREAALYEDSTASAALDGALHSVWLHGDWRWLTRNMTTEEREAAADAVARYSRRIDPDADPLTDADLRWWRQ